MGCVIPGLSRVGYNLRESWIEKSIKWLISRQNEDGGFGETVLSYNDPDQYNGRGKSTVSQTAWALLALLEVPHIYEEAKVPIERSVNYLLKEFVNLGQRFFDTSVVGTGHRGVLYL
jgi:squalene-hopene/tetraprenyl-beta-curcumene cyclase